MFNKIITIAMGILILGSVGCQVAETKDNAIKINPKTETARLDGLNIKTENANSVKVTANSVEISASQPAKVQVKLDGTKDAKEDKGSYTVGSDYWGGRALSLAGEAPNSVAAMRQGIQYSDDDVKFWSGKTEGYGLFEKVLDWLKSAFWWCFGFICIAAIAIAVMWVIPVTRPIAVMILKWLSSLIPIVSGIVAWVFQKKTELQLTEVINGGQKFLAALDAQPDPVSKSVVKDLFLNSQSSAQSTNTKEFVRKVIK